MARSIVLFSTILMLSALVLTSCREKVFTLDVDCDNCFNPEPETANLILHWTQTPEFDTLTILLYRGTIDKGTFIDTFDLFGNPAEIEVEVDHEYSVEALYYRDSKTYHVVDGTHLKLKRVSDACDQGECWTPVKDDLHIELKY